MVASLLSPALWEEYEEVLLQVGTAALFAWKVCLWFYGWCLT
jgi:hypothetical protein